MAGWVESATKARLLSAACIILCIVPLASVAEVWDLATDFSGTQNPTGAWSYGWRASPGDPLIVYTDHEYPCAEVLPWLVRTGPHYEPSLVQNPHDYPVSCYTWTLPPHKLFFHPGPAQQSVVRWTAPEAMEVQLNAHFVSIDFGDKIVHVYHNQDELFASYLANDDVADFSLRILVDAGDVIDCAIDPISFYYDATMIDVTVERGEPTPVDEATWGHVRAIFR